MLLEKLSDARGISGFEDEVRMHIKKEVVDYCDVIKTDPIGNLYAIQEGKGKKVCLLAHMDEVGMIVTAVEKGGIVKFETVGGIKDKILPALDVLIGPNKIPGVVGSVPIHLQKKEDKKNKISKDSLWIDVGDGLEDEIEIGQMITFSTKFKKQREVVFGKAFDDRIGCLCLIKALKSGLGTALTCVFTVQEEIGLRGARIVGANIDCNYAIACEGTFALDLPLVPDEEKMPQMGSGPAITIADRSIISNPYVRETIEKVAMAEDIPFQYKKPFAGGTDAGAIHLSGGGIPSCVVANPCRYIHSPCSIAHLKDIKNTEKLVANSAKLLSEGSK
ncbi:MAG: M42 family metallopeptidase [Candidatus Methanofastidiosia archaeon]